MKLAKEEKDLLDYLSDTLKLPKSVIIIAMLRYFMAYPEKLYAIEPLAYEEAKKRNIKLK